MKGKYGTSMHFGRIKSHKKPIPPKVLKSLLGGFYAINPKAYYSQDELKKIWEERQNYN